MWQGYSKYRIKHWAFTESKPVDTDLELVHGHCCGGGAGLQDLVEAGLVLEADLRGTAQQLRLVGHERRLLLVQHRLAVAAGSLIGDNSC